MSAHRLHQDPLALAQLTDDAEDLWRLHQAQAYFALAGKSAYPALTPDRPAPSLLILAETAGHFARQLAQRLQQKADLAESIVLARLLGAPAGGELSAQTLSRLMQNLGGFSLNSHSLRVVDELEIMFPEFNGLNLTWPVRASLGAKPNQVLRPHRETEQKHPERAIAAFATRLGQLQIDLLYLTPAVREEALRDCPLWNHLQAVTAQAYPQLESRRIFRYTLHQFLQRLWEEATLVPPQHTIALSPQTEQHWNDLEVRLAQDRRTASENSESTRQLEKALIDLFYHLNNRPQLLPEKLALRVKKDGVPRVTCDYLASLADQSLLALAAKLCPAPQVCEDSSREQLSLL
jgi:dGTPase